MNYFSLDRYTGSEFEAQFRFRLTPDANNERLVLDHQAFTEEILGFEYQGLPWFMAISKTSLEALENSINQLLRYQQLQVSLRQDRYGNGESYYATWVSIYCSNRPPGSGARNVICF